MTNAFDDMEEDLFDTFDDIVDATYTPTIGDPVSCRIHIEQQLDPQPLGYESQAWASRLTIEYRLDEVGQQANRGDIFTTDSVDYEVQSVIEGDQRFCKVAVKVAD